MTRRPAVTLMEVLIAMFIMAIGMLALLALFPVGAVSMAQVLKDDRCATTASMAEHAAVSMNVRYDLNVTKQFATLIGAGSPPVVYVDPYGALQGLTVVGATTIPRITTSLISTPILADRWFSLPDDITFNQSGTPDTSTSGGIIDRGRRYSYAYLLKLLPPSNLVSLQVVAYSGRPTAAGSTTLETTDTAATITGTNSVQLSLPLQSVTVKRAAGFSTRSATSIVLPTSWILAVVLPCWRRNRAFLRSPLA